VFANSQAEHWLDQASPLITNQSLQQLVPSELYSQLESLWQQAMAGQSGEQVMLQSNALGLRHWHIVAVPCMTDATRGVILIATDISQSKQLEQELRQRTSEAEQSAVAKAAFIANMSHEIRTPMNAVLGMLSLLLEDTELNSRQLSFAQRAHHAASALLSLLNDILDASKLEAGKLELHITRCDICTAIDQTLQLFSLTAQQKDLALELFIAPDVPEHLQLDELRLMQIITNLVGNAIKFTEKGSVCVTLTAQPAGDNMNLQLSVKDTGIGMTEAQVAKVFDQFTQADEGTTRRYGGTGLGLSICQQLVDLMHGHLSVTSVVGEGSEFHVVIPTPRLNDIRLQYQRQPDIKQVIWLGPKCALLNMLNAYRDDWALVLTCHPSSAPEHLQALPQHLANTCVFVHAAELSQPRCDALSGLLQRGCRLYLVMSEHQYSPPVQRLILAGAYHFPLVSTPATICQALSEQGISAEKAKADGQEKYSELQVLVVDDLEINGEIASHMLQQLGIHCELALSGEQALKKCQQRAFDLVLMDIHMDGMDGMETTRQIRQQLEHQPMIVALSASAMDEDKQQAISAGMDDHLNKPLMLNELRNLLQQHFGLGRQPEATAPTASLAAPGFIDEQQLLQVFQGDAGQIQAVLRSYAQTLKEQLPQIDPACERDALSQSVHRIKGIAANVGDRTLQQTAEQVELAALAEEELSRLSEQMQHHALLLKEWLQQDTESTAVVSASDVPDLASLEAQLEAHEFIPQDVIDALYHYWQQQGQGAYAAQLRDHLDQFNFQGALEVVHQLQQAQTPAHEHTRGAL
jgi:signal transduction histidine kinase/DNA-binding response OmpR family regulator